MKKLLVALALIVVPKFAFASSWGDVFDRTVVDSRFTILESVQPIYRRNLTDGINQGGAISPFYKVGNGWLTADAGWSNSIQDTSKKGGALMGGSVHPEGVFNIFAPEFVALAKALLPDTARKIVDATFAGFDFGHDFQADTFSIGYHLGLGLKFGN